MNNILTYEDFLKEHSDYRNVTGYGTMGGSGDQRTGPSFNKGPDSATYRLPSVIGVETDDISDPYFAQRRTQKMKRIKKNKNIERNRKDKTKYLRGLEKDTQKNKIMEQHDEIDPYGEEVWSEKEERRIKKREKRRERLEMIKHFFSNLGETMPR